MKTHPSAPLTTANAVYYRAIERARRKLKRANSYRQEYAWAKGRDRAVHDP